MPERNPGVLSVAWSCRVVCATTTGFHAFCPAFVANHLSTSDRSQPPDMCFAGKVPFLHQRKSVERLTPTTRTTSLVDIRASMPANRSSAAGSFGAANTGSARLRSGGTTSMSDNWTGRFTTATPWLREPFSRVRRRVGALSACGSRAGELLGPFGTAGAPDNGIVVLIVLLPTVAHAGAVTGRYVHRLGISPDPCITLQQCGPPL